MKHNARGTGRCGLSEDPKGRRMYMIQDSKCALRRLRQDPISIGSSDGGHEKNRHQKAWCINGMDDGCLKLNMIQLFASSGGSRLNITPGLASTNRSVLESRKFLLRHWIP